MSIKILMIAPSSIPLFGAEAIVNAKLLQLLTNNGFKVDLLSKRNKWENYPADLSLDRLKINLNRHWIIEVDNRLNFSTILQHFVVFLKFGSVFKGAHWALKAIRSLDATDDYDFILTKDSPSLLVGYYLKRRYGLKWVASWNDPFPQKKYPRPYGKGALAQLPWFERRIIKIMEKADVHIFPTERLKRYMMNYLSISEGKTLVIPHVVDEGGTIFKRKGSILKVLHSGNLMKPRDPRPFIQALKKLSHGVGSLKIHVDFVGVYDADLADFIDFLNMKEFITLLPPISYEENIESLRNYDLALIVEAPCQEGIFLPTKVGDYMQGKIPIFSISPRDGVLNDLYKEGYVQYFSSNDEEQIHNELKIIYKDFLTGYIRDSKTDKTYFAANILNSYKSLS